MIRAGLVSLLVGLAGLIPKPGCAPPPPPLNCTILVDPPWGPNNLYGTYHAVSIAGQTPQSWYLLCAAHGWTILKGDGSPTVPKAPIVVIFLFEPVFGVSGYYRTGDPNLINLSRWRVVQLKAVPE